MLYYALSTRPVVSPAVAARLIELMRGEGDRGRAMWGLTHHGISPQARATVIKALLEELDETVNPGERGDLIFGLAALGGDDVVAKLKEIAEKDENEKTREDAADALRRLDK